MAEKVKIVMTGEIQSTRIAKGLITLRMKFAGEQVTNYIKMVQGIGGKQLNIIAKVGDTKIKMGEFVGRTLNIDLRDGDAIIGVEADLDELAMEIGDLKTMEGNEVTFCIIMAVETEEE